MRIFVSYRRDETGGHAGRLYDALSAHFGADNVFIDIDAIDLGAEFAQVIHRAVTSCHVVIAMIGRDWVTATDATGRRRLDEPDDFVRLELESALARDVFVIPACVQGAAIPSAKELPPTLAPLAGRQGFELRDSAWHDDVNRLIRRIERLAGETLPAAEPTLPPAPAPSPPRRRRWKLLVGLALALAALGGIAAALTLILGGGESGARQPDATAEKGLLAVIPAVTRPSCQSVDYGAESARVSLSCSGPRLSVLYHLFPDNGVLDDWYAQQRELAAIDPGSGTCTADAFRGEGKDAIGGAVVGRHFCFVDSDGESKLVWSDRRASVGAEANVYEGKGRAAAAGLLRQWRCCLAIEG